MPLFKSKKRNSGGIPPVPTTTVNSAAPTPPPPVQQMPPQKQVIKIVGEEKHITTEKYDEQGRKIVQTKIVALTDAEKQQFGITSQGGERVIMAKSATGATTSTHHAPPPAAAHQQQHHRQQQPPPPAQQTYQPPVARPPPQQTQMKQPPPPSNNNVMRTPADHASAAANSGGATTVTNLSFGDESLATIEITRDLVKRFISDIWNRGEVELIPMVCHPSLRFNGHVGMDRVGHEGFARMVTTVREALTDYHCEIHSMVVETNKAFCRLRFTGKHTGNLLGYPPTGKTVSWMGASEFTCKNGKILKVWELGDVKSLEDQLRSSE